MTDDGVQIIYCLWSAGLEVNYNRCIAIPSKAAKSALSQSERHDRRKNHAEIPNFAWTTDSFV